jgi:hypothetical protein
VQQQQAVQQQQLQQQCSSRPTRQLPNEIIEWTVDDVIYYISSIDPTMNSHADLFKKHVSLHCTFFVLYLKTLMVLIKGEVRSKINH